MIKPQFILARQAQKDLLSLPPHIANKLLMWMDLVENKGWLYAKSIPGYRCEILTGRRFGQRSIRLSKGYRAMFCIEGDLIEILEVNKHDY
jgi:toxin HigB-1